MSKGHYRIVLILGVAVVFSFSLRAMQDDTSQLLVINPHITDHYQLSLDKSIGLSSWSLAALIQQAFQLKKPYILACLKSELESDRVFWCDAWSLHRNFSHNQIYTEKKEAPSFSWIDYYYIMPDKPNHIRFWRGCSNDVFIERMLAFHQDDLLDDLETTSYFSGLSYEDVAYAMHLSMVVSADRKARASEISRKIIQCVTSQDKNEDTSARK